MSRRPLFSPPFSPPLPCACAVRRCNGVLAARARRPRVGADRTQAGRKGPRQAGRRLLCLARDCACACAPAEVRCCCCCCCGVRWALLGRERGERKSEGRNCSLCCFFSFLFFFTLLSLSFARRCSMRYCGHCALFLLRRATLSTLRRLTRDMGPRCLPSLLLPFSRLSLSPSLPHACTAFRACQTGQDAAARAGPPPPCVAKAALSRRPAGSQGARLRRLRPGPAADCNSRREWELDGACAARQLRVVGAQCPAVVKARHTASQPLASVSPSAQSPRITVTRVFSVTDRLPRSPPPVPTQDMARQHGRHAAGD